MSVDALESYRVKPTATRTQESSMAAAQYDEEFSLFVAESSAHLLHGAELLVGDRSRAEDLLQHALLGTYLRWGSVREGNPKAYVRKAMLNYHLDWWRRRRWRETPLNDHYAGDQHWGEPLADLAVDVVRRDAVQKALQCLTRRERAVIVLRYWFDLSEEAIAAELNVAPGTVKSTASRALKRLRQEDI